MSRMLSLIALLPPLLLMGQSNAADEAYVGRIHEWQREHDTDVRTGGWLLLVGRYEVAPGASSIGSDPGSVIVLPESAPPRLGVLTRTANVFQFEPAPGVAVTIDGAPAAGVAELTTSHGKGRVAAGSFSFVVRTVGDDPYLLAQDTDNPAARKFKGTEWFPVDSSYRVPATFAAYAQPQSVPVPMTHIESKTVMSSTGYVIFRLHGARLRLRSLSTVTSSSSCSATVPTAATPTAAEDFCKRRCRRMVSPRLTSTRPSTPSARSMTT
jgi:uncharacterized protein